MKYYVVAVFFLIALPVELLAGPTSCCIGTLLDTGCSVKASCGLDYCKKYVTTLLGKVTTVSRTCESSCTPSDKLAENGFSTFCCDTDDCNSGTRVGPSLLLLLLPLIAIFVGKRML